MRTLTRFIPGEEIDAVAHWDFGAVDTRALDIAARARAEQHGRDLAREEALRQESHAQGFAQGQAHATLAAQQSMNAYIEQQGHEAAQRFGSLFAAAQEQLAQSQQVVARGVLELACELARQVLLQELSVNPNVLQPVLREALDVLVADTKSAVVRLNPLDLEVLRGAMQVEFPDLALTLVADASLQPGGCVVAAAGTVVDASVPTRWRRVVAQLGLEIAWEDAA